MIKNLLLLLMVPLLFSFSPIQAEDPSGDEVQLFSDEGIVLVDQEATLLVVNDCDYSIEVFVNNELCLTEKSKQLSEQPLYFSLLPDVTNLNYISNSYHNNSHLNKDTYLSNLSQTNSKTFHAGIDPIRLC